MEQNADQSRHNDPEDHKPSSVPYGWKMLTGSMVPAKGGNAASVAGSVQMSVSGMFGFTKHGRVFFHVYDPDGNCFNVSST